MNPTHFYWSHRITAGKYTLCWKWPGNVGVPLGVAVLVGVADIVGVPLGVPVLVGVADIVGVPLGVAV